MRWHRNLFASCLMICAAVVAHSAAGQSREESGIVVLPEFEVNGVRPWLYAEIPGYQVLSLASEKDTRAILERLQRAARFTSVFFPDDVQTKFTAPCTLFLQHFAGAETLKEVGQRMKVSPISGGFWTGPGDAQTWLPTAKTTDAWLKDRHAILANRLYGVGTLVSPAIPVWYRECFHALVENADVRNTFFDLEPTIWSVASPLPIEDVVTVTTDAQFNRIAKESSDLKTRLVWRAALFAHWGLFGDGGKRRRTFLEFVSAASRAPIDEATFQRFFGLRLLEINKLLNDYARRNGRGWVHVRLPPEEARDPLQPVLVRPASPGEVARMVGESYVNLGAGVLRDVQKRYFANARSLLTDAYEAGDRDPRLLAVLGMLEFHDKNDDKAREYLEAAVAAKVQRPEACAILSLLRYRAMVASTVQPDVPSPEQIEAVLAPLQIASTMKPRIPSALEVTVDTWMSRPQSPSEEELDALNENARLFPHERGLLFSVVRLNLLRNRIGAARAIFHLATGWPAGSAEIGEKERTLIHDLRSELGLPDTASGDSTRPAQMVLREEQQTTPSADGP